MLRIMHGRRKSNIHFQKEGKLRSEEVPFNVLRISNSSLGREQQLPPPRRRTGRHDDGLWKPRQQECCPLVGEHEKRRQELPSPDIGRKVLSWSARLPYIDQHHRTFRQQQPLLRGLPEWPNWYRRRGPGSDDRPRRPRRRQRRKPSPARGREFESTSKQKPV